ncbi:MAG: molybdopterin-dependent oxidoreductase [Phycisphaeraceae bacterium]
MTTLHAAHVALPVSALREATVVCPGCSTGCRVSATVGDGRMPLLAADSAAAPNFGRTCDRVNQLSEKAGRLWDRLRFPMMRRHRGDDLGRVSWDQALTHAADEIQRAQISRGRQSVGWLDLGRLDMESAYLFAKLFKGFLGSNNTDVLGGQRAATQLYTRAFGADGSPACFDDIEHAQVILLADIDLATTHPVLFERIMDHRLASPHCRLMVIDSKRTTTASRADVYVPAAPGKTATILQLVAKRLLAQGHFDARFVRRQSEGFTDYRVLLESMDETVLLSQCGVHPGRIDEIVEFVADGSRLLSFTSSTSGQRDSDESGPSEQRSREVGAALVNLQLQLGQVGQGGTGLFMLDEIDLPFDPATVGVGAALLPGHRSVGSASQRLWLEQTWGVLEGSIPIQPGLNAEQMLAAAGQRELSVLWLTGEPIDPQLTSEPSFLEALAAVDFVILQTSDAGSPLAQHADVLLPSAHWLETTGTTVNAERRVLRSHRLLDPPGEAKPDWWVAARTAEFMGFAGFHYDHVGEVWNELISLTADTVCDYSGLRDERLGGEPMHWPCPHRHHPGLARRYASGRFLTPSGRARFLPMNISHAG